MADKNHESFSLRFDENATCDACGAFGAYAFDDAHLCAECYEKQGSCCPEFGADDLWESEPAQSRESRKPEH